MKLLISLIFTCAALLGLGACGKVSDNEFDTKFSNGGASTTYYYNGQPVHSENYGKLGYGVVNCVYSQKYDKFSLDMYVPEESDVPAFADASEGVFLELYSNKGMPTNISIGINGNQQSKVNAMLPGSVVQKLHHFSTIAADSHCNFSIRKVGNVYDGTLTCSKLRSAEVSGTLDLKTTFQCDSVSNY